MALPKIGDWVVRAKYPSKFLEPGKAYLVTAFVFDVSYSSDFKIQLEGVEPMPNGTKRWFDPEFFEIVGTSPTPKWEKGAKVECVTDGQAAGWPYNAAKLGEEYTIKTFSNDKSHIFLEETPFLYKVSDFKLAGVGAAYVPKPKPKVVIYNQQAG